MGLFLMFLARFAYLPIRRARERTATRFTGQHLPDASGMSIFPIHLDIQSRWEISNLREEISSRGKILDDWLTRFSFCICWPTRIRFHLLGKDTGFAVPKSRYSFIVVVLGGPGVGAHDSLRVSPEAAHRAREKSRKRAYCVSFFRVCRCGVLLETWARSLGVVHGVSQMLL